MSWCPQNHLVFGHQGWEALQLGLGYTVYNQTWKVGIWFTTKEPDEILKEMVQNLGPRKLWMLAIYWYISRNPPISWYQKPKTCWTIHSNLAPFLFCSTDSAAQQIAILKPRDVEVSTIYLSQDAKNAKDAKDASGWIWRYPLVMKRGQLEKYINAAI